ncbi:MAG: DEAD/DEAH box helicase, partial [Solirubrobacteraceae bacterium]|nr:DEAD/DEAH box helicase [Solirubrobacteraceae bacterium]
MTSPTAADPATEIVADLSTPIAEQSFRDLGVSNAAAGALEKRGYVNPLPVQAMVLPDILEGKDILAKSPTGSGKTLAFMVPLLDSLDANNTGRPGALILAPTRELASQIVEESREVAHALALRVVAVYGGVGLQKQARDAARAHVIVATPGRLEDLIQRRAFSLKDVEILVLDEADRMLDMGFKPAIDRIVAMTPDDRQTLFFSATLDGEAGRIAKDFTVDAQTHIFAPPERPITEMDHRFVDTKGEDKVELLLDALEEERGLAIVFVRTKHGADRLARRLDDVGVDSGAMHGGKSQSQRERALKAFERGKINVLVATDVAARGIDIDDITHVINYDAPEDREAYVHRTGRTGRAGRVGISVTLVAPGQEGEVASIVRELGLEDRFEAAGLDPFARAGGKKKRGGGGGGGGRGYGGGGGGRGGFGGGGRDGGRSHGGDSRPSFG